MPYEGGNWMLRDRYEPMNLFTLVSALSLALDPVLTQLDRLLDDDTLFQAVKADLSRRFPRTPIDGRPSTPVEVILRMLVVKYLYGWSYEATARWVSDSLVWRQCCRVYVEAVPDETTLLRWANLIEPATLHRLLDHVVRLARALKVTPGRKLRLDGTVVETHIQHPTDRTWRYDGVRVLSRVLTKAKHVLQATPALARQGGRDRTRRAKRHMQRMLKAARQRGAEAADRRQTAYQHLLDITLATIRQAQQAGTRLKAQALPMGRTLAKTLDHVIPLVGQVVTQTTRRVLQGDAVPASAKLVSLFEPHTAMIRKGKPGKPPECGRVIWLDEVEGRIISRYAVLGANPAEDAPLPPSLDHHLRIFKRPPRLLAGDRGVHSTANERYATAHGAKPAVLPKPGAQSAKRLAHEQQRCCRRGHNWRSGIEGRISGLKRRHKLDRCRYHGTAGMARWVGWGVITHHLRVLAQAMGHEPAGAALHPCHGFIRGEILLINTCPQRVLHQNLVLGRVTQRRSASSESVTSSGSLTGQ
jgi:IS5 family transposase